MGTAKSYSSGINNYPWNTSNSPPFYIGLSQGLTVVDPYTNQPELPRLDQVLLSFNVLAYLSRDYVQDGITARGQGRILVGFVFQGADGQWYVVEMNFANMRTANIRTPRVTSDCPSGNCLEAVSNAWRDDIWAENITTAPNPTFVLGARNPSWGYNLVENQETSIFFDPWWVVTSIIYRAPSSCPDALNPDGSDSGSNFDAYGVMVCGDQASAYGMPVSAIYDANGNIGAHFSHAYIGIEMAGSAVTGNSDISGWTYQRRW